MKKVIGFIASLVLVLPLFIFAQDPDLGYFDTMVEGVSGVVRAIVPVLMALAVVYFIFNVIRFVIADESDKKEAAKSQMIWGIVGLAVIASMWGIVKVLQTVFGVDPTSTTDVVNVGNVLPF